MSMTKAQEQSRERRRVTSMLFRKRNRLAPFSALDQVIDFQIPASDVYHEGYLRYVTDTLLSERPEDQKHRFFGKKLKSHEIRSQYLSSSSMEGVLSQIGQHNELNDENNDPIALAADSSAGEVIQGNSSSISLSPSLMSRLNTIYPILEPTLQEEDLFSEIQLDPRAKSVKKRQRALATPIPRYSLPAPSETVLLPAEALKMPLKSHLFERPLLPTFIRGPASKMRRLYVAGCGEFVEYHFASPELHEVVMDEKVLAIENWLLISKRDIPRIAPIFTHGIHMRRKNAFKLAKAAVAYVESRLEESKDIANQTKLNALKLAHHLFHTMNKTSEAEVVVENSIPAPIQASRKRNRKKKPIQTSEGLPEPQPISKRVRSHVTIDTIVVNEAGGPLQESNSVAKVSGLRDRRHLPLLLKSDLYIHILANVMDPKLSDKEIQAEMKKYIKTGAIGVYGEFGDDAPIKEARKEALELYRQHQAELKAMEESTRKRREKSVSVDVVNLDEGESVMEESMVGVEVIESPEEEEQCEVEQPMGFEGNLRPYQLKGLEFMIDLYKRGVNGILADESGLGKVVQAVSMLGYLAEKKRIWGPFLIVVPPSCEIQWFNTIRRFYPAFKVLIFSGLTQQRKAMLRLLNLNYLYRQDSEVHIVITEFNRATNDDGFVEKLLWEYTIIDEAHLPNSKFMHRKRTFQRLHSQTRSLITLSSSSMKPLDKEFCTVLPFLMPQIVKTSQRMEKLLFPDTPHYSILSLLNTPQLSHLFLSIQPLILKRLKSDVHEPQTEFHVLCDMSPRQHALYAQNRSLIPPQIYSLPSISNSNLPNGITNESLFSLVMQLRNIANHPDLVQPLNRTHFPIQSGFIHTQEDPETTIISSSSQYSLQYHLPRLIFDHLLDFKGCHRLSTQGQQPTRRKWLEHRFNIFDSFHIHSSIFSLPFSTSLLPPLKPVDENSYLPNTSYFKPKAKKTAKQNAKRQKNGSSDAPLPPEPSKPPFKFELPKNIQYEEEDRKTWSFTRFLHSSPSEVEWLARSDSIIRWMDSLQEREQEAVIAYNEATKMEIFQDPEPSDLNDGRPPIVALGPYSRTMTRGTSSGSSYSARSSVNGMFELNSFPLSHHNVMGWKVLNGMVKNSALRRMEAYGENLLKCVWDAGRPKVVASHLKVFCGDRRFDDQQPEALHHSSIAKLLFGEPPIQKRVNGEAVWWKEISRTFFSLPSVPIAMPWLRVFGSGSIRLPSYDKLVRDSGKLKMLDELLKKLKTENHRILLYSQFTEVLDLLEELLAVRGYSSIRLDGLNRFGEPEEQISDLSSIFVFLSSTRKATRSIDVTCADTIIFYDTDWNVKADERARERLNKFGQSHPFTIYRFVLRDSIEERILQVPISVKFAPNRPRHMIWVRSSIHTVTDSIDSSALIDLLS